MQVNTSSTLTVLHDGQFWVGICEQRDGALYGACRFVFGPEPADEDVLAFVRRQWDRLDFRMRAEGTERHGAAGSAGASCAGGPTAGSAQAGDWMPGASLPAAPRNPKRAQREARKAVEAAKRGVGTKAQQALSAAYEERKEERRADARERREEEARRAFELRTLKRKEKHRGH